MEEINMIKKTIIALCMSLLLGFPKVNAMCDPRLYDRATVVAFLTGDAREIDRRTMFLMGRKSLGARMQARYTRVVDWFRNTSGFEVVVNSSMDAFAQLVGWGMSGDKDNQSRTVTRLIKGRDQNEFVDALKVNRSEALAVIDAFAAAYPAFVIVSVIDFGIAEVPTPAAIMLAEYEQPVVTCIETVRQLGFDDQGNRLQVPLDVWD
jgi:hypothetical protein